MRMPSRAAEALTRMQWRLSFSSLACCAWKDSKGKKLCSEHDVNRDWREGAHDGNTILVHKVRSTAMAVEPTSHSKGLRKDRNNLESCFTPQRAAAVRAGSTSRFNFCIVFTYSLASLKVRRFYNRLKHNIRCRMVIFA